MAAAFLTNVVDKATAAACRDYQRLAANKEPERKRAWVRLAVVLTVLGFTAWAVEYIAVNSSPSIYKAVDYNSTKAQAYFSSVPPDPFLNASSNGMIPDNITCPCLGQPYISWCQFIDFYLITCNQETNNQLHVTPISMASSSSSCQRQPPNVGQLACRNTSNLLSCTRALDTIFDFSNTNTYIDTLNLASSFEVFYLVSTKMQSSIHGIDQTTFKSPLNLSNPNGDNHSILILSLLQVMVDQVFNCTTSSSIQQFWDKANQCVWNLYPQFASQFNDTRFAFGMTINYQAYSTACKPEKCKIFGKDSLSKRLVWAMGEVGGVGSLILLGLQIIVWPLVAKIFKFPFESDFQLGEVGEHIPYPLDLP